MPALAAASQWPLVDSLLHDTNRKPAHDRSFRRGEGFLFGRHKLFPSEGLIILSLLPIVEPNLQSIPNLSTGVAFRSETARMPLALGSSECQLTKPGQLLLSEWLESSRHTITQARRLRIPD